MNHCPPKAKVTSSNLVGRAILFKDLGEISDDPNFCVSAECPQTLFSERPPPDPEKKNPAAGEAAGGALDSHNDGQHQQTTPDASGLQARRLRRMFGLPPSTARTIAGLAFATVPR